MLVEEQPSGFDQDKTGHIPFLYSAADDDWPRYTSVILDPIVIYREPDQEFGKLSDANKIVLADYIQTQFSAALRTKYAITAGPSTLRVHVTLTGAETNTPTLGTVKDILPVGALINTAKSAADSGSAADQAVRPEEITRE